MEAVEFEERIPETTDHSKIKTEEAASFLFCEVKQEQEFEHFYSPIVKMDSPVLQTIKMEEEEDLQHSISYTEEIKDELIMPENETTPDLLCVNHDTDISKEEEDPLNLETSYHERFSKKKKTESQNTDARIKLYECEICNKTCKQKSNLKTHLLIHSTEKPHKCDICYKAFSRKNHLLKHVVSHSSIRPYECNICNKAFSLKQYLVKHKLTHTGVNKFKCDICNKTFSMKHSLLNHELLHTGRKPQKCDICYKDFAQKKTLIMHTLIHTGERPHKCDICDKSFSRKNYLTKHLLIHTGERPFKCDICAKSFPRKNNLLIHLQRHNLIKTA